MKFTPHLAALVLAVTSITAANAQQRPSLHVTGTLQGYQCMMLNITVEQMQDFDNLPPVMAEPSAQATRIGVATANVIVAEPRREANGYIQVLHMDGRPGWLQANKVRPWVNATSPRTRCVPAMMSNNRPGFQYINPQG